MRTSYIVAFYDVSLAYGGPEEGGWWYDTGEILRVSKVFRNPEDASDYCSRLSDRLHAAVIGPNRGRPPKHSVLSRGWVEALVFENYAPLGFPEERPHYA